MTLSSPPITREHGSWAILFIPLLLGIITSPFSPAEALAITVSLSSLFLAYTPLELLLRKSRTPNNYFWFITFLFIGAISGFWLILFAGRTGLMVFAFCAVVFYTIKILLEARLGKNLWSDASGIAMLTLSAPAARYAITGQFDAALADIYLISAVHFIFGGIFVHLLIIGIKDKARRERGTKVFIAAAMILLTGMVSFYGWIMLAVFLPLYVYIFSGLLKSEARPNFKKTGLQLLAHSFWFLIIIAIYI